jgi:hypothetical protein
MAAGGRETVDNYPEVQAVAYAQWFTYAFALWEEQFRGRVADYFDQRSDEHIRRSDVLIDYFGDIRLITITEFADFAEAEINRWPRTDRLGLTPRSKEILDELVQREDRATSQPGTTARRG